MCTDAFTRIHTSLFPTTETLTGDGRPKTGTLFLSLSKKKEREALGRCTHCCCTVLPAGRSLFSSNQAPGHTRLSHDRQGSSSPSTPTHTAPLPPLKRRGAHASSRTRFPSLHYHPKREREGEGERGMQGSVEGAREKKKIFFFFFSTFPPKPPSLSPLQPSPSPRSSPDFTPIFLSSTLEMPPALLSQ